MVNQTQRGFSLIELMIATSLLSMVMFTGYFAYSLYTDKWQKRADYFWQLNQNSLGAEAVIRVLEAANIYIIKNNRGNFSVLFEGDSQQVTLVTNSGIFSNRLSLIRFEALEQNDGLQKLLYSELPLTETSLSKIPENPEWQHQNILLDDITKLNFQYYGYQSTRNAQLNYTSALDLDFDQKVEKAHWYTTHSVVENRLLPSKMAIYFENTTKQPTHIQVDLAGGSYLRLIDYIKVEI